MNDIRLVAGVLDHPKTVRLIMACGQDGFFCLLRLWFWARDYRPDGMLAMDPEAVEIVAKWQGEKGLFHSTLISLGWIDPDGGLHDWAQHQTWAVGQKARTEKARAASKARWDARFGPKQQGPDARSIPKSKNEQTLEESPSPLLSSPLQSQKKEPLCSEASPSEPPVITFDCIQGKKFHVYADKIKSWDEVFPAVDVLFQLKKARQWIEDHPTKRKTLRGMLKFCNGWLSRAQDESWKNGNTQSGSPPASGLDPTLKLWGSHG